MRTILKSILVGDDKDENFFRFFTFLFIQFVLVSINLFAGFVTYSMSLTACVGYYLVNLFIVGNEVVKNIFPDTKVSKVGRAIVLVVDSVMAMGFSAIVINEFFIRLHSPVYFSEPLVWTMIITSMVSAIKSFIYGICCDMVLKKTIVPLVVFVSMILMRIFDCQVLDSYIGLAVSLFVIYFAIKMMVRAWIHRKNF
ncbi:MAG: hypothetical protein IJ263_05915 [Paludibacteraceae bacterium]|nr:hypothetical protein [Paludibacteraceae bacterium]MBR6111169.1 hypothetical protein [Paludibacteraceae bacterium]